MVPTSSIFYQNFIIDKDPVPVCAPGNIIRVRLCSKLWHRGAKLVSLYVHTMLSESTDSAAHVIIYGETNAIFGLVHR